MKKNVSFFLITLLLLFNVVIAMERYTRADTDMENQSVVPKRRCPCNLFKCLKIAFISAAVGGVTFLGWKTNHTMNNFDQFITEARGEIKLFNTAVQGHQSTMRNLDHVVDHVDDLFHQDEQAKNL